MSIALYFFIFNCFLNNINVNKARYEYEKIKKIIISIVISLKNLQKSYRILKNTIMISFHKFWKNNPLGKESSDGEVCRFEIDENKIVSNQFKAI